MMKNENKGKLMLKVKKRRNAQNPKETLLAAKANNDVISTARKKRTNPFSVASCDDKDIVSLKETSESVLESDLKKSRLASPFSFEKEEKIAVTTKTYNVEELEEHKEPEKPKYKHELVDFPLDWSIRHQLRILSSTELDFCKNLKQNKERMSGIMDFARANCTSTNNINKHLSYWVHPSIPGLPRYPIKRTITGLAQVKNNNQEVNVLSTNQTFQKLTMKEWQHSFQSLFNMLRSGYCPYFYVCGHQQNILFVGTSLSNSQLYTIITPTTKGLRNMLEEEDIHFEFTTLGATTLAEVASEEDLNESFESGTENNAEFLDSIGLSTQTHFPRMEEAKRLNSCSKLKHIDNRPESTIKIDDCNALFNFLLNATFLCAPSGAMTGIPPTLLSPSPFEGGVLARCKPTYNVQRHQRNDTIQSMFCLDISGAILPSQAKEIVNLLVSENPSSAVIQLRSYNILTPFSSFKNEEECQKLSIDNRLGLTEHSVAYLKQSPHVLPYNCEIFYEDGVFKF